MSDDKKLKMSFDPHTIEHLGVKMYSNISNAIAELIANAYDADAECVFVNLYNDDSIKKIEIIDDGDGMTFDEINDKFLRIGRKRREEEEKIVTDVKKRKITGKKGLGKLAFFGIGTTIEIVTIRKKSGKKISFKLDWEEIINTSGSEYEPTYSIAECSNELKGTTIILKNLKRKSPFSKNELAISISKLFNCFDDSFKVYISHNEDDQLLIDNKLKFENINPQFEWDFPEFLENLESQYSEKIKIKGKILSTEKPLKPGVRGITLFANGRLVNAPEFFGVSESSHGFSYFTGWLDVDFVDDWKEDVISTDRQSLNWDLPNTIELRNILRKNMSLLERQWSELRKEKRREKIKERAKIDVPNWFNKLPKEVLTDVESVIKTLDEKSELEDDAYSDVVGSLHSLVPEYPYYHWRHLSKDIHPVSQEYYMKEDYFQAAVEAIKKFEKLVQTKTELGKSGFNLMETTFGSDKSILLITRNESRSEKDIENGHENLSKGLLLGFRNPAQHEFKTDIFPKIFNDDDCLDILSLTSYLIKKLEQAQKR